MSHISVALRQRDPVLQILDNPKVSEKDIYLACEAYSDVDIDDVIYSYHIWISLQDYLSECETGMFLLLDDYDFDMEDPDNPDSEIDQFHLDLAIKIGSRAQCLLDEIYQWDIGKLKRKVNRLLNRIVSSDAVSILTMLVLRIVSKFSKLEFRLHLALSKSILIKINYELTGLLRNISMHPNEHLNNYSKGYQHRNRSSEFLSMFSGANTNTTSTSTTTTKNPWDNPLLIKYRSFVRQLIQEMENTPFESVQQEMFQVVHDLRQMFVQFSKAAGSGDHTEDLPSWDEHNFNSSNDSSGSSPRSRTRKQSKDHEESCTISQELPSLLQAFEDAKQIQQHNQSRPMEKKMITPKNPTNTIFRYNSSVLTRATSLQSSLVPSPMTSPAKSTVKHPAHTLEVEMVGNRVMVKTGTGLQDMQEWLNQQNNQLNNHQSGQSEPSKIKSDVRAGIPKESGETRARATGISTGTLKDPKESKSSASAQKEPKEIRAQQIKPTDLSKLPQQIEPSDRPSPNKPKKSWIGFLHKVEKDMESNYTESMGF